MSAAIELAIEGIGVCAAGLADWAAAREVLRGTSRPVSLHPQANTATSAGTSSAMDVTTRVGVNGHRLRSSTVVDPVSTRILLNPRSVAPRMSVSMVSPIMITSSVLRPIRFRAARIIQGFGFPT